MLFLRFWRAILGSILLTLVAGAVAAPPAGYTVQLWETKHGLPQNAITAILQSREGYIWLATYGGIVRFDGARFRVFNGGNTRGMENSRVTSLFEDRDGVLWIGHETGELTRLANGRFEPVPLPPNDLEKIIGIFQDNSGKILILHKNGRVREASSGIILPAPAMPEQLAGMITGATDKDGVTWFLRSGSVMRLLDGVLAPVYFDHGPNDHLVFGIGRARAGGIWVANGNQIRRWHKDGWVETRGILPGVGTFATALEELADGSIAMGTVDQGMHLIRAADDILHFDRNSGLPQDWIRALCVDHEGNLWAGIGSGGLAAIRRARAIALDAPDHWQGRGVLGVTAARDGALWVGSEGAGLYRYFAGEWSHFSGPQGIANPFVWSLAEDKKGRLWVGTWGGGVFVRDDQFERAPGTESIDPQTPALYAADDDALWIGTGAGLVHYREGKATPIAPGKLTNPDVRTITQDAAGVIWFGMSGGGLGRLENGEVSQFRKKDGLASDFIQCLLSEPDGTLWIGTADSGLVRRKGDRFATISSVDGLPNNVICHIAEDGHGFFWMSTHRGIVRVAREDLNKIADGQRGPIPSLVYGLADGMPTLQCSGGSQPAGCRSADGRLWFSTITGLVAVDPNNVWTNPLPPRVLIENFIIDQQPFRLAPKKDVVLPPGRREYVIEYTGLSFSAPERVNFRYRLQGLENEWRDAGTERRVVYSYLPAGQYAFQVIACNNDGVWNNEGATLAFTVLPYFWQTLWFRVLAGTALVLAAGLTALVVVRRRYRLRLEAAERQQAIERERARIAQDIHDDIGASLTRITLLSQSGRADDLDRIYDTARNLTRSLDEIVWAVNPRHDTLDSLASYLGKFAQDFVGGAGIRCRLDVPVSLPTWPLTAETRHNVFLSFKEALNNSVKHADATEVKISLVLGREDFCIAVEDNGRGFMESSVREGNGIGNIRRRIADIGGACEIQSAFGKGTTIRFKVPLARRALS